MNVEGSVLNQNELARMTAMAANPLPRGRAGGGAFRAAAAGLAGLLLVGGCAGRPAEQLVRVAVTPADADCVLRTGERVFPLAPPERVATIPVTDAPAVVTCRRAGFADATEQRSTMQHGNGSGSGPLLLMLDSGTFARDTYPSVIRVDMARR